MSFSLVPFVCEVITLFCKIKDFFRCKLSESCEFPDESYFATRYTLAEIALPLAEDTKKPFPEVLKYLNKIVRSKND